MGSYHAALYIHFVSLLLAIGAAGVVHVSDFELRRATTLGAVGSAGLRQKAAAKAFPVAIVGLLASGAYMTHHLGWPWSSGWIVTGLVGVALIAGFGDAVNGRNGKRLGALVGPAIAAGGPMQPVPEEVRALLDEPLTKIAALTPTLLALGVVYAMTEKPDSLGCALALAVPLLVAGLAGPRLLGRPAVQAERPAATEPA